MNTNKLPYNFSAWPDDSITIDEVAVEVKYVGFKKVELTNPDKTKTQMYQVMVKDGRRYNKTVEQLEVENLIVPANPFCDPFPGDKITSARFIRGRYLLSIST